MRKPTIFNILIGASVFPLHRPVALAQDYAQSHPGHEQPVFPDLWNFYTQIPLASLQRPDQVELIAELSQEPRPVTSRPVTPSTGTYSDIWNESEIQNRISRTSLIIYPDDSVLFVNDCIPVQFGGDRTNDFPINS